MKASLRAKRMSKHHSRHASAPKLNLVSLMDIFTILVFFLLVNSSDVEVLSNDKTIQLPESIASKKPDTTLLIKVNADDLLVGTLAVAKVSEIIRSNDDTIPSLKDELIYQASRRPMTPKEQQQGRAITIMGDQSVPYTLIKRIMQTCAENGYRDIALAVTKVASKPTSTDSPSEAPSSSANTAAPLTSVKPMIIGSRSQG